MSGDKRTVLELEFLQGYNKVHLILYRHIAQPRQTNKNMLESAGQLSGASAWQQCKGMTKVTIGSLSVLAFPVREQVKTQYRGKVAYTCSAVTK